MLLVKTVLPSHPNRRSLPRRFPVIGAKNATATSARPCSSKAASRWDRPWRFDYIGGSSAASTVPSRLGDVLSRTRVGDRLRVVGFQTPDVARECAQVEIAIGSLLHVLSNRDSGSVLVAVGSRCVGLGAETASQIAVAPSGKQV